MQCLRRDELGKDRHQRLHGGGGDSDATIDSEVVGCAIAEICQAIERAQVCGEDDAGGMLTTTASEKNAGRNTGGGGDDDNDDNGFDKNDQLTMVRDGQY